MSEKASRHFFIDACAPRDEILGLIAYPYSLKGTDAEYATFYTIKNGAWKHKKFEFDARSIVYLKRENYNAWWILGKRGEIAELSSAGINIEQIPDVGTLGHQLGYVNKIVQIEGSLVVCGYRRQVYLRENNSSRWVHIDQGIIHDNDRDGISLSSIHGLSLQDIHAVGTNGEIWRRTNHEWRKVSSPTNVHLHEVFHSKTGQIFACGNKGTVLTYRGHQWSVLENEGYDGDLWGVCEFRNQVFVSGFGGIGKIDGDRLILVDIKPKKKLTYYRLAATENFLWSIGSDHIFRFDGKTWEEISCPDNQ